MRGRLHLATLPLLAAACGSGAGEDASGLPGAQPSRPLSLDRADVSGAGDLPEGADLENARFRELVMAAFGPLPSLPARHPEGRLDVIGALEPTFPGERGAAPGDARLTLEARIRARGLGEPVTAGVVAIGSGGDRAAVTRLVEGALADLARGVRSQVALLGADEGRLLLALDSAEPDEQILAARLLSERRSRNAVEALGRLLEDPRPDVAEAAADALTAIGAPEAVPLAIRSIRRGDLRSEVRAIEIMGAVGGAEAEAYLEMTAVGHEVEEVRRISEATLERLREGKGRGGAPR